MKKTILILSFSPLDRDPRVFKQILWLNNDYHVIEAGLSPSGIDTIKFVQLQRFKKPLLRQLWKACLLKFKAYDKAYWLDKTVKDALHKLHTEKFDLIIANDIKTLPLAVELSKKNKSRLLVDAHEYTPRDFDDQWTFRFFFQPFWHWICQKYLPKVDAMTTVCMGIADEYNKNYGVKCEVMTSAPFFANMEPSPVNKNLIKIIHHGILNASRKLENMIFLMDHLDDRFILDFMLINNENSYYEKLKKLAHKNGRVKFRDPVSMLEIAKTINNYDIGIFLLWPGAFSYRMALPNKLFEFVQGRLAVAIWPSPEMASVVKEYDLGVVSDDFSIKSVAEKLNSLSVEDIQRFKKNAHSAASRLCAERNRDILLGIVKGLTQNPIH